MSLWERLQKEHPGRFPEPQVVALLCRMNAVTTNGGRAVDR